MHLRTQIIGATLLAATTYFSLLRIAEAKNEAAVGSGVFRLTERHREEQAAFDRLRAQLDALGESALSERLERLRQEGRIWIAPFLGPERWAVFVESLGLVRRIYIRRLALLDPRAHLYPQPRPDIPTDHQAAFACLSLAGALRHELAHYDGILDEAGAYEQEIAWYESLRGSPFLAGLPGEARRGWEWAIESAILSARKARQKATS